MINVTSDHQDVILQCSDCGRTWRHVEPDGEKGLIELIKLIEEFHDCAFDDALDRQENDL